MIDRDDMSWFLAHGFVFGTLGSCIAAAIYGAVVLFPSPWSFLLIGAACFGVVWFALCLRNAWRR